MTAAVLDSTQAAEQVADSTYDLDLENDPGTEETNALAHIPKGYIMALENSFVLYPTSLMIVGDPSFDTWSRMGLVFQSMSGSAQWWWGEWLLAGEDRFGENFAQVVDDGLYSEQGLKDIVWVCQRVLPHVREKSLSFEHHRKVAPLDDPDKQAYYLKLAIREKLSAKELAAQILEDLKPAPGNDDQDDNPPAVTDLPVAPPIISGTPARIHEVAPVDESGDTVAVTFYMSATAAGALAAAENPNVRLTVVSA